MNTTVTDLCFLCTKDYNCVPVNSKIEYQVEYLLPEITIFKLGIPLRICSGCEEALCAFSTFKHSSLESSRRLETSIKGALGPPLHTAGAHVADNSEQLYTKPVKVEEIFIKEEPMEQTSLDTQLHMDGPSAIIQPQTHRAPPNSTTQLQRVSAEPQNQLHKHELSQNIQLVTDTNSDNAEHIFIKEEILEEIPQDRNFYINVINDLLKEECNTKDKSATLNRREEEWAENSADFIEETDRNVDKNKQINKKKEYRCNICNSLFAKQMYLTYHMKKNHWRRKNFSCSICKKIFTHQDYLNKHVCNKLSKTNLSLHIKNHSGVKDLHCKICSKSFERKGHLVQHMKIHCSEIKDFQCNICSKSFKRKCHLVDHMKIHSGVKDFHCDICNKSFKRKYHLFEHMKVHSGVKDFQCDTCNKSFSRNSHLVNHMKIHFGIKDFQCDICNKSFRQKCNLVVHMKTHSE